MADDIHGVTFIDYAAACAFQAQGKPLSDLLPTLGVTEAQWQEADAHWQGAMAKDDTFALATKLGEVFQNPAVGKFAGSETPTATDQLSKVPDVAAFIDLQEFISVATEAGIDPAKALAMRDMSVSDYSQVSMHYMVEINDMLAPGDADVIEWHSEQHIKARRAHKIHFGLPLDADEEDLGE